MFRCPFLERIAMPFSRRFVAFTSLLLSACAPAGTKPSASNSTSALATAAHTQDARALSYVEKECSGCHALRPGVEPPNQQAPSFVTVANDMGFTEEKLREFFQDGHDDPMAMSIHLTEDEANMAAAYIMSLRSPR